MPETRISVCSHDCPDACSVKVGVLDGRMVSIEGDPDHPVTRGFLCGKVNRYAERVYHPARIKTPLRRIGKKGEGRFAPITWDEALAEITERFRAVIDEFGAEAILPFSYAGNLGRIGYLCGHRFFHGLGASRLARTICSSALRAGMGITMGRGVATDIEQVEHSELVIAWGVNAVATHIHLLPLIKKARARGGKLVVIDVYRNATARQADWFVQIRPGTDSALALGMMRLLIEENLYDPAFVDRYTLGFEDLREACAPYSPEHTAQITGVPAAEVVRLARAYGRTKSAFLRLGLGISRHSNGGMTIRTISCLPALTGAWEAPGGGFHALGAGLNAMNQDPFTDPHPDDPPSRQINMVRLGEALLEADNPPVKALYVYNSNPAAVVPEQAKVHQGLSREDLFCVVHEQVPTDTVDFADIVLPATNFLEHDDLVSSYGHNYLQLSRAALPPAGEAKSNLETFQLLGRRMGLSDPLLLADFETLVEVMLDVPAFADNQSRREQLMAGKPVKLVLPPAPWRTGLLTPSGKFEFRSQAMADMGQSAVPAFVPSAEGHLDNGLKGRYPLQLVTPPAQHLLNSSFGETESSRRLERTPRLKLHPSDAKARRLADGEPCRAFNDRGECFLSVEITDQVQPGVAVSESIWWPKAMRERKGINQLTSAELTDLGGGARFHDGLVEVEKA